MIFIYRFYPIIASIINIWLVKASTEQLEIGLYFQMMYYVKYWRLYKWTCV